jgi:hypothetical protein
MWPYPWISLERAISRLWTHEQASCLPIQAAAAKLGSAVDLTDTRGFENSRPFRPMILNEAAVSD